MGRKEMSSQADGGDPQQAGGPLRWGWLRGPKAGLAEGKLRLKASHKLQQRGLP